MTALGWGHTWGSTWRPPVLKPWTQIHDFAAEDSNNPFSGSVERGTYNTCSLLLGFFFYKWKVFSVKFLEDAFSWTAYEWW